jgi:hypothetical protein
VADREPRGIFGETAKLHIVLDKLLEVLVEDRLRRARDWLKQRREKYQQQQTGKYFDFKRHRSFQRCAR